MAQYRLSGPARADIAAILRRSRERFGEPARIRYRALIGAALRRIAADPTGRSIVDRSDLGGGIRSFHIRHSRAASDAGVVARPVHVVFFRVAAAGIEVVRVLHEQMEPSRYVDRDR